MAHPSTRRSLSSTSSTVAPPSPPPGAANMGAKQHKQPLTKVSHFQSLIDPTGITPEVLDYQYVGHGTRDSPYLVELLPNDARNPLLWTNGMKWANTGIQAMATLAVTFASSSFSGGFTDLMQDLRVSSTVAILPVSMFTLGFAIGPLFWAPLSELYGRQRIFFLTYMGLTAFSAGAAGAPNMTALAILRFLAGASGSSALTNAGGVIADMFSAAERGHANALFALAPFLGPALGPIAGGFLADAYGWRWVGGMVTIFVGIIWIFSSLTYAETYVPFILRRRAEALSKRTGKVYMSKLQHGQGKKTSKDFMDNLLRPWILLFTEPIVFLTSLYTAVVLGIQYLLFAAFPIVFQRYRGWSAGVGGLAFVGIIVGMLFAVVVAGAANKRYTKVAAAHNGMAPPEARLPGGIIGSVCLPIGLFWFAWTNGDNVHWAVPIVGSSFFGFGTIMVFVSLINYLIDSYVIYAASVLAANSVLRSLFGAAFPLFTSKMYENLGIHWASSIPAFLALACMPFPFLFWKFGQPIRMKCKYSAEAAAVLDKMRSQQQQQQQQQDGPVPSAADVEKGRTPANSS